MVVRGGGEKTGSGEALPVSIKRHMSVRLSSKVLRMKLTCCGDGCTIQGEGDDDSWSSHFEILLDTRWILKLSRRRCQWQDA